MKNENYGAPLERGVIEEITDNRYRVTSIDRDGITSRPIKTISSGDLEIGDKVYFFLFPDGTGLILCKMD